jgi:hypothetical protein
MGGPRLPRFTLRAYRRRQLLESQPAAETCGFDSAAVAGTHARDELYSPAVFEGDNRAQIIPAIEGLAYPASAALGAP